MNILLLAPSYFGLYLPVKDALEKKGHNVTWIDDVSLKYPYKRKDKTIFHRLARKIVSKVLKVEKRFWDSQKHILDKQTYDLFLVINGCCYCPYVKELLKRNNKTIKLVQYAWDANKYYDFFHYKSDFDKLYSFDYDDSKEIKGVKFLPIYWKKSENLAKDVKYDVSLIGSDHDNRFNIVNKVIPQLKERNVSYCFKIYSETDLEDPYGIIIKNPIPIEETNYITSASNCIFDTDREIQTGVTPRLIWALANGKKVISTNKNLSRLGFVDMEQVRIVDRNNPIIDIEFLLNKTSYKVSDYLKSLEVDNWVENFL